MCTVSSELHNPLPPNLVQFYIIISWSVLWKYWIAVFKVKVTAKVQTFSECLPEDTFWTTWPFAVILGMVMHHYQPQCHLKRLVCYLQGQGHTDGSYDQNVTISIIPTTELQVLLQPDLQEWYTIITWSVLWIHWIVVFKINTTMVVQNVIEYLSALYLLCHWSLCNQTRSCRCVDVLLLITKPSANKF